MLKFAKKLNEEEHRHVRQQMTEEELAIFDILTKPRVDITAKEAKQVKKVAKDMLLTLKAKAPPPRLTERDYLLEELDVAEKMLQFEEARFEKGVSSSEKVLGARRSVLSPKRQLAAHDERIKRPTPEQEIVPLTNVAGPPQIASVVPSNAVPKLIQIARESPNRGLRQTAIQRLMEVKGEPTSAELVAIYEASGDNELRQWMVQQLGNRPDPTAMGKLVAIARTDPDPRARQLAVDLIGRAPFDGNPMSGIPSGVPRPALPLPPSLPMRR
ncbi:MAG TPA: hypothetical protein P5555_17500 [Candidatus Paceibacterota bacterium]|nr:hypothetical protein [Verrucomicrobiota bacterium]HRZ46976.1 hypothetical protein [Candidatus Paceibacterota bacterium]HRZ93156.1 hypothetical protein [Candidatus Paceibacterota bacterium]